MKSERARRCWRANEPISECLLFPIPDTHRRFSERLLSARSGLSKGLFARCRRRRIQAKTHCGGFPLIVQFSPDDHGFPGSLRAAAFGESRRLIRSSRKNSLRRSAIRLKADIKLECLKRSASDPKRPSDRWGLAEVHRLAGNTI
jgi:hypothetical protein